MRRPPVVSIYYGLLLLAMAAGQIADTGGFADILRRYDVFGGAESQLAGLVPAIEFLGAVAILFAGAAPESPVRALAPLGLAVAAFWTIVAAQAFARDLALPNCGCFGVYLGQPLRWWVFLEDAAMLALAWYAVRASGLRFGVRRDPLAARRI